MPEATFEKETCGHCGVDVRENTLFCYNCGSRVAVEPTPSVVDSNGSELSVDVETKAALDDLAERFKIDEDADGKLAKAAAERRGARVVGRRAKEFVWEPEDEDSSRFVLLLAVLITVIVAAVVFLTVYWK